MWKEIAINVVAFFQGKIFKFILPKIRRRVIYRKKLKLIVNRFSDCFVGSCRTYNLENLIRSVQADNPSEQKFLAIKQEAINLLKNWYTFYKSQIDSTFLNQTSRLFDEFGYILVKTHGIVRDFVTNINEDSIDKLKKNESGYPTFRQKYSAVSDDFSKLTQEASQELKEIKDWSYIALPEL
jgi:hypothetical protein